MLHDILVFLGKGFFYMVVLGMFAGFLYLAGFVFFIGISRDLQRKGMSFEDSTRYANGVLFGEIPLRKGYKTQEGWVFNNKPEFEGWYAIMYCWDVREGTLVGADHWCTARKGGWRDGYPVTAYHGPFIDKSEAEEWADMHDPESGK